MEMGKHIIVFITAILMPFMAYGANCSGVPEGTCNTTEGCEWIVDEISGDECEPCGAGTYKEGGNPDIIRCIDCNNAPKDCGTDDNLSCKWMQGKDYTGLTSNTCPWTMDDVEMTITYLDNEPINIFATLSNLNDGNTTDNEKKLVIKIEDKEKKFSTISDSFNNNQIVPFVIQLNEYIECTINSMEHNGNQLKLVCNYDQSLSEPQISSPLSLTVTAKKFTYVLVPMNSVEDDNDFSVDSAGNASGVKYGYFGDQIKLENTDEKATYKQYNNCEYDTTNNTVNCKFDTDPTTTGEPTNGLLTLDYKFTYTDDTIIVLERATECQEGKYCPTYTTTGDKPCPNIFWSDKNAISIKDCYLDSSVIFVDNNNKNNPDGVVQLIPQDTKVYYRGNSNK